MDAIDIAIADAWNKLAPQLMQNRAEALRRAERMTAKTLRRPVRPWCCCIRASDPRFALKAHLDPKDALQARVAHTLCLPASALRRCEGNYARFSEPPRLRRCAASPAIAKTTGSPRSRPAASR